MDIEYKGANSVVLTTKKATVVTDPRLSAVGLKDYSVKDAILLATTEEQLIRSDQKIGFEGPGEYEVADLSIRGVAAALHFDSSDAKKSTMYTIDSGDVRVGILGNIKAKLSEQQLEDLGTLDVLILPIGGGGYTLDAAEATALTRQISPKVVIPIHYADSGIKYEVPQDELSIFVKDMGAPHEVVPKLKIKNGILPETLTVIEVNRSN